MRLEVADEIAKSLIKDRLPRHWRWELKYHNSVTTWGWCSSETKVISLSRPLICFNGEALLREVVLHEIAHAIVDTYYHKQGHNQNWKRTAIALGSSGRRLIFNTTPPPPRFQGKCDHCGNIYSANKRYLSCEFCPTWGTKLQKCKMAWGKHPFWESLAVSQAS